MSQEEESILSPDERRVMLEEIGCIGLTLGRTLAAQEGERRATGSVGENETITISPTEDRAQTATPLERLHLLEALWPEIETALARLTQPPRSALHIRPVRTLLERSRGGNSATAAIARTPEVAFAWSQAMRLRAQQIDDHSAHDISLAPCMNGTDVPAPRPLHVQERRPLACYDTLLNRFAAMLLLELEQETQHLAALAAFCADVDARHRAGLLGRSVARWRAGMPFAVLSPLTTQERARLRRAAIVPQWEPAGRALYASWLTLHRPLHFDWSQSALLQLPALAGWHLYEIWCFMAVAGCLVQQGWEPVRSVGAGRAPEGGVPEAVAALHCAPDGLRLRLATGQASDLRFRQARSGTGLRSGPGSSRSSLLTLTYQPLFPSANQRRPAISDTRHSSYSSLSHVMQPDIALQWQNRLYLLDAKFRRYAPREQAENAADGRYNALLEDVDKMHTYRDSIVQGGKRVVRQAWCLFPGHMSLDPDIISYPAGTPEQPFGSAGIGAVSLRPGQQAETLSRLLAIWLPDSTG